MTDDRTTELLRELRRTLEKCRRTEEAGFDTYWITAVALDTSLDELEQAIAATLGRPKTTGDQESIVRSFLRKISPNRDWDYLGEHEHAMIADLVDDIAAMLGSEREKALEELLDRWHSFAIGNGLDQSCADYEEWCALERATLEQLGR